MLDWGVSTKSLHSYELQMILFVCHTTSMCLTCTLTPSTNDCTNTPVFTEVKFVRGLGNNMTILNHIDRMTEFAIAPAMWRSTNFDVVLTRLELLEFCFTSNSENRIDVLLPFDLSCIDQRKWSAIILILVIYQVYDCMLLIQETSIHCDFILNFRHRNEICFRCTEVHLLPSRKSFSLPTS